MYSIFRELPTSYKVDRHLQNKQVFQMYHLSILKEKRMFAALLGDCIAFSQALQAK